MQLTSDAARSCAICTAEGRCSVLTADQQRCVFKLSNVVLPKGEELCQLLHLHDFRQAAKHTLQEENNFYKLLFADKAEHLLDPGNSVQVLM